MKHDSRKRREIENSLKRILTEGSLGEKSRLRKLLSYLIREELEGHGDRLKAYAIGVDVFGRSADFDPNNDSIVRVEMTRLRQALDVYYAGEGAEDPIRIAFSKGSYRPHFKAVSNSPSAPLLRLRATPQLPGGWLGFYLLGVTTALAIMAGIWLLANQRSVRAPDTSHQAINYIPVLVTSLRSAPGDEHLAYVAGVVTDQIVAALARSKTLSVFNASGHDTSDVPGGQTAGATEPAIKYLVQGTIQVEPEWSRITVEIRDADTGNTMWAQTYRREGALSTVQDELVTTIAAELRPQIYNAAKRDIALQDPETASAWQLYLRTTWSPGEGVSTLAKEIERLSLARQALKLDPDFGQAHSVVAEKLTYLANIDSEFDTQTLRSEAEHHAHRALELASDDADAVFNIAIHYW